jgi:hypothetical protein
MNLSSASIPKANSRLASDRLVPTARERNRSRFRRNKIFGAVDNAEILAPSALDRGLGNASTT